MKGDLLITGKDPLSAGVPGGRRSENSRAVQAESEQDSPGEGEGRKMRRKILQNKMQFP